jgi:hypothetical protein
LRHLAQLLQIAGWEPPRLFFDLLVPLRLNSPQTFEAQKIAECAKAKLAPTVRLRSTDQSQRSMVFPHYENQNVLRCFGDVSKRDARSVPD